MKIKIWEIPGIEEIEISGIVFTNLVRIVEQRRKKIGKMVLVPELVQEALRWALINQKELNERAIIEYFELSISQ